MRNYNLTEEEVRIIQMLRRAVNDSQRKRDKRVIVIEVESRLTHTGMSVMAQGKVDNMPLGALE